MTDHQELPADVVAALKANRKIEAIKLLREHGGYGLKEAKEIIDAQYMPAPEDSPLIRTESGPWRLILILVIVAAAYGVYVLMGRVGG